VKELKEFAVFDGVEAQDTVESGEGIERLGKVSSWVRVVRVESGEGIERLWAAS